jgi:hypothetical protein
MCGDFRRLDRADLWAKDQETVDRITEFLGDNR